MHINIVVHVFVASQEDCIAQVRLTVLVIVWKGCLEKRWTFALEVVEQCTFSETSSIVEQRSMFGE